MSQLAKYREMRARMVVLDADDEALSGLLDEMDVVWEALSAEERAVLDAEAKGAAP